MINDRAVTVALCLAALAAGGLAVRSVRSAGREDCVTCGEKTYCYYEPE
ncbi:hypothetical protein [Allostreptomyces psammosilenae]|uniref:Uncharacterized protein n=1 Tax=Allostreptomyces psammosilenae TaxID=1892865 RepID=A0A852ZPS1_9ACTN|nr:hypothetical protein [Allostreptomyces psammosilenae]NYI04446.1 hypothetical protein [Allostreptomyces psammosilenae]